MKMKNGTSRNPNIDVTFLPTFHPEQHNEKTVTRKKCLITDKSFHKTYVYEKEEQAMAPEKAMEPEKKS